MHGKPQLGKELRRLKKSKDISHKEIFNRFEERAKVISDHTPPYSEPSSLSRIFSCRRTPSRLSLLQLLIWGFEEHSAKKINRVLKLAGYEAVSASEIADLQYGASIQSEERPLRQASPVDEEIRNKKTAAATGLEKTNLTIKEAEDAVLPSEKLYEYPGGRVSAIRLYGAADQCLAPTQIKVKYEDSQFPISDTFEVPGEARIRELTKRRDHGEIDFFDGPCARLLRWVKPSFEAFAQDGRPRLELVIGPVGWYDVERTNGVLRQKLLANQRINYEHWIGLSSLTERGSVEESRLSNIVGNAITILTTDGQVGYGDRGERQSVGAKQLSSAVAENLHRYFDDTEPGNPLNALHPLPPDKKLSDGPDNEQCPPITGELHPTAAVTRGLTEETSYKIMDYVDPETIKCTGLCFSLDALQPDLLWIVPVQLTAEKFTKERRIRHGKDWQEGRIRFVPADFTDVETQRILARTDWIAGGKASLVRAIELIDVLTYRSGAPAKEVFKIILRHTAL